VEPAKSTVIAGGTHEPHKLQGIGTGFIPANLHADTLEGTIAVTEEEAFTFAQRAAREEGLFVGISSGASLAAVAQHLRKTPAAGRVLTFCYDTGERYLSVEGLFAEIAALPTAASRSMTGRMPAEPLAPRPTSDPPAPSAAPVGA